MDIHKIRQALVVLIVCIMFYLYKRIKRKLNTYNSEKAKLAISSSNKLQNKNLSNEYTTKEKINKTVDHKEILLQLHEATDKCYVKMYAVKCIHLINYCPHLMNIPHGPEGYTPFHRVCFHGNACLIEYMLAKGANPFLTTYIGENAICMALYYFLKNPNNIDFTCLDMLCEAGCYLDTPNIQYDIFIKAALNTNNKPLAEWILIHSNISKPLRSYSAPSSMHYIF